MKTVRLSDVRFKSSKVQRELRAYLNKLPEYRNFSPDMIFLVWVRHPDNDFIALEAKDTLLSFHSKSYRPSFFLNYDVNMAVANYQQLLAYV